MSLKGLNAYVFLHTARLFLIYLWVPLNWHGPWGWFWGQRWFLLHWLLEQRFRGILSGGPELGLMPGRTHPQNSTFLPAFEPNMPTPSTWHALPGCNGIGRLRVFWMRALLRLVHPVCPLTLGKAQSVLPHLQRTKTRCHSGVLPAMVGEVLPTW